MVPPSKRLAVRPWCRLPGRTYRGGMATTTSSRAPWLVVLGVLLAVAAAALITFTDLAWRGLIGWPLLVVALLLVVTGGIRRGQRRRDTHRA